MARLTWWPAEVSRAGVVAIGRGAPVAGEDARGGGVALEDATAGVASDAPRAGRQPGALQPFHVADRPQRGHHHVGLDGGPVREPSTLHVSARVALQRMLDIPQGNPVTEVRDFYEWTYWNTTSGMIVFTVYEVWKAMLQRRPIPEWMHGEFGTVG